MVEVGETIREEEAARKALNVSSELQKDILAAHSKHVWLLRDVDWEKIFQEVEAGKDAFAKYLSLFCIKGETWEACSMVGSLARNEALYDYIHTLPRDKKGERA